MSNNYDIERDDYVGRGLRGRDEHVVVPAIREAHRHRSFEPIAQIPMSSRHRTRSTERIHHVDRNALRPDASIRRNQSRHRTRSTERIHHADRILYGERIIGSDFHSDDEGGYYTFRGQHTREAYPTLANVRNTTSNYYEGGLGREAWRRKFLERRRVPSVYT